MIMVNTNGSKECPYMMLNLISQAKCFRIVLKISINDMARSKYKKLLPSYDGK